MKELEYSIFTSELNGIFTVYSPELSISFQNVSVDKCHHQVLEVIEKKKALFKEVNTTLKERTLHSTKKTDIKPFIKKWGGFFISLQFIIIFSLISLNVLFTQIFNHRYLRLERKVLETLSPTKIKQEKRMRRFKKKIKDLGPYVKETKQFLNTKANNE